MFDLHWGMSRRPIDFELPGEDQNAVAEILRAGTERLTPMILWAAGLSRRLPLASRDHDYGLRSRNARLRRRTDCSPPQVGRGAARGRAGRGWLGVGACAGQGLGVHSQPAGAAD